MWVPVLKEDSEEEAKSQSRKFATPGVTQFYDADLAASLAFKMLAVDPSPRLRENRLYARGIVWDSFFLFDRGARWGDRLDPSLAAGGPVIREREVLEEAIGRLRD